MLGAALTDFSVKGHSRPERSTKCGNSVVIHGISIPVHTVTGTYNGTTNSSLVQASYAACIPSHDSLVAYQYSSKIHRRFLHQQI